MKEKVVTKNMIKKVKEKKMVNRKKNVKKKKKVKKKSKSCRSKIK